MLVALGLVDFVAQRGQVRIVALRDWQAHGDQHGIFFGLLDLALLLSDACSLGSFRVIVAFGIPAEVAPLLPAADGGHERVAEVVFAMRIVLDVFPLEVGTAAATAFFAHRLYKIHGGGGGGGGRGVDIAM